MWWRFEFTSSALNRQSAFAARHWLMRGPLVTSSSRTEARSSCNDRAIFASLTQRYGVAAWRSPSHQQAQLRSARAGRGVEVLMSDPEEPVVLPVPIVDPDELPGAEEAPVPAALPVLPWVPVLPMGVFWELC